MLPRGRTHGSESRLTGDLEDLEEEIRISRGSDNPRMLADRPRGSLHARIEAAGIGPDSQAQSQQASSPHEPTQRLVAIMESGHRVMALTQRAKGSPEFVEAYPE
jgi:hypothetical protein